MIAMLFMVEQWPFGRIFLMTSLPLPFILFLPVYFYESKKDERISSTFVPVLLGLMFIAVFSVLLSVR